MPNYGDASLFYDNPAAKRETYFNKSALRDTIFPNDVVHKTRPNDPLKLAWADKLDHNELATLQYEGYKFVSEEEFDARPYWRWDNGKLCSGAELVLMWMPLVDARQAEEFRRERLQDRIDGESISAELSDAARGAKVDLFQRKHERDVSRSKEK